MRVALYARVSKALDQNPENQLIELRRWAEIGRHEVEGEYIDEISSRDTRPNKEIVLRKLRLGLIDCVAFWSLDRWGRSMSELVLELEEFSRTGRVLMSMKEGIDLSSAAGRLMANVLAAMANFERDRIQERTLLGLARARAQGKKLGRPRKYDINASWVEKLSPKQRERHNARKAAREAKLRLSNCQICGSNEEVQGHHPDYSKPKEIITLCKNCHSKEHNGKRGGVKPPSSLEEKEEIGKTPVFPEVFP